MLQFCVFQRTNSAAFSEAVVDVAMVVVAATNLLFNVASIGCVVFWYELLIDG